MDIERKLKTRSSEQGTRARGRMKRASFLRAAQVFERAARRSRFLRFADSPIPRFTPSFRSSVPPSPRHPVPSSPRRLFTYALLCLLPLCTGSLSVAAPPAIFFTDLTSGPNSGGENNNGAYVTLYGSNFGASPTVTVGGGSALVKLAPAAYLWYQKMTIQLGPNANTGNIVVTSGGEPSNGMPFTVRAGHIYFVTAGGSDANMGSAASPWRTPSKAVGSLAAGDIAYVGAGVSVTSGGAYDDAFDWAAQGTAGNPVALIAYPGASPAPSVGPGGGTWAVRCATGYTTSMCQYFVLAGFTLRGNGGGFLTQYGGSDVRLVGNDISCPNGDGQIGCVTFSQNAFGYFYGNYVHDNATVAGNSSKQYHSVYFTTDSNHAWVGWNKWFNNKTCRALQFHSSPLCGSCPCDSGKQQYDLHVHDNVIDGDRCNGINFASIDPSKGTVEAYNNLIMNVGLGPASPDGDSEAYAAIYLPGITNCEGSANPPGTGTVSVYNNTFWHDSTQTPFGTTGVLENVAGIAMSCKDNLVDSPAGVSYIAGSGISGDHNLWFGNGAAPASGFSSSVNSDPLFVSLSSKDFHLQSNSPAVDKGAATVGLATDLDGVSRPQGAAYDIGAYEFNQGSAPPPPPSGSKCDLNSDNAVNVADVQVCVNQVLGVVPCTNADLQGNGACNAIDVQRVVNAALGQTCMVGP